MHFEELYLHARLLPAALGTLYRIAGLAASVVTVSIGLAPIELRQRLVLVAPPAQLDGPTGRRLCPPKSLMSTPQKKLIRTPMMWPVALHYHQINASTSRTAARAASAVY